MKLIIAAFAAASMLVAGDIPAQTGPQANKPSEPVRCIYIGSQMCQIACVMGDGNVYCVEYAKLQQKKAGDAILAALIATPAMSACPRGATNAAPPSCYACHAWIPQPDCTPTLGTACPPPGYRATL